GLKPCTFVPNPGVLVIAETLRNRISDPKRPLSAPKNIPASEVRVPKGLIFPINPQGTIRLQVTALDGESYTLLIGDVEDDSGSTRGPQLTLKHWRLLIRIL